MTGGSDSIRLVVFDAGGVLVRLAPFWEGVLARAGLTVDIDVNADAFRVAHTATSRGHQLGALSTDAYLARVSAATGLTAIEVAALLDAHLVEEYQSLDQILDCLARHGIGTALLSNTNAYHWRLMLPDDGEPGRFPSIRRLDHHFGSHRLRLMKPDPAIYAAVEEATGMAGPEILFFDDLADNVAAARTFGWSAVQIDPAGSPAAQMIPELAMRGVNCGLRTP